MATDEAARHRLYQRLEDVLGLDEAHTLMAMLPTDLADLATKQHIGLVEQDIALVRADLAELDARWEARLHRELASQTRLLIFAMLGSMFTLAGLNIALVQAAT